MAVEDEAQPDGAAIVDDLIHDLDASQANQVSILATGEVNAIGRTAGIKELVTIRQPDGVVAQALDLVKHVFVVARPQTMHNIVGRLKPEPVDASDAHLLVVLIQDEFAAGVPITCSSRICSRCRRSSHGTSDKD